MGVFRVRVAIGVFLLAGVACAGDGTGLDGDDGGDEVTLSRDVQPIFTGNCTFSGCHAGSSPEEGMSLVAGQAFSNVVNVAANQASMNRVTPNQPDNSYLVHKVQGTHLDVGVGGSGSRMPLNRSPLSQSDIDLIRAWIQAGAQPN
ncbi:MAG: hypothetical protein IIA55_15150 [Gemmatimonadetes bacterium]|nr:hypothetical protein [Gemmatimonadota bacterium]